MTIWKGSTVKSFLEDDGGGCEVRIDGATIVVSYEHNGPTIYRGEEVGQGHYELTCPAKRGRATLHRSPDSNVLEGHWTESGNEGMWRIELE
jgi:hypothetical protein